MLDLVFLIIRKSKAAGERYTHAMFYNVGTFSYDMWKTIHFTSLRLSIIFTQTFTEDHYSTSEQKSG